MSQLHLNDLCVCPHHFVYGDSPFWSIYLRCQLKLSLCSSPGGLKQLTLYSHKSSLSPATTSANVVVVVIAYHQGESRYSLLPVHLPLLSSSIVNHKPSLLLTFISSSVDLNRQMQALSTLDLSTLLLLSQLCPRPFLQGQRTLPVKTLCSLI